MSGADLALSNALGEITLAVFTSIAPSAVLAALILLVPLSFGSVNDGARREIRKNMWIPLLLCMVGLIASATHLGNPANALYVLSRVGASPLSNEVFTAAGFLALVAAYWLCGFMLQWRRGIDRALRIAMCVMGLVFLGMMSVAYSVPTIRTWDSPFFMATVPVSAFMGGPLVALLVLWISKGFECSARLVRRSFAVSIAASIVWVVLHLNIGADVLGMHNELYVVADLVPMYGPMLVVASVLLVASYVIPAIVMRHQRGLGVQRRRLRGIISLSLAALLIFVAIFIMRFSFYMMHLTVGVAV